MLLTARTIGRLTSGTFQSLPMRMSFPLHTHTRTMLHPHVLNGILLRRSIHDKPSPSTMPTPDIAHPTKLPFYDMPMSKQVRHLRMVFLVNVFCSTAISLWVRLEDVYTVLAAGGIMTAGFIPLALIQLIYRDHIRSIRILGPLSKRAQILQRKADPESQIEYPLSNDTPLLIEKFSLTGSDPKTPLYVGDLRPDEDRKYSVQWVYEPEGGRKVKFRVSKKVIQFHPDVRALDQIIRQNDALGITTETSAKQAKKLRKKAEKKTPV